MASRSGTAMLRQTQLLAASKPFCKPTTLTTRALFRRPSIRSHRLQPSLVANVPRFAPFSTSLQKKIMPPGPQVLEGGVNDPAPVPKPSPIHGSYHWTFERFLSVGLIPLTITPFASGSLNPTLDAVLVFTLIVHSHMGFQNCITDYFSTKQHPRIRKFSDWLLNISTVLVAIAFYEFETNDVGVTAAIERIWHAGKDPKKELTS